ncbi:hypothetical protein Tco_0304405 [Tanacetum coccineum]
MPTEMELTLEQTQQGVSYEVSVDPHGFEGNLKMVVKNYQRPLDHLHESQLYPEVPESVLGLLTAVPAVMKHVRSTPLSMTPEHRYDDPGSKCESCIPEAHMIQSILDQCINSLK